MSDHRTPSNLARLLVLTVLCSASALSARAATPFSEEAVMAAYLVRFAGYVEWPDETAKASTASIDSAASIAAPPSTRATKELAIQSPRPVQDKAQMPLTIAVLGANEVWDELVNLVATQSAKQRPLRIRRITSVTDIGDARIVFIGADHSDRLKRLVASLANRPVLTVTDNARGLELGSILNFMHADRRVRFEVSIRAAKKAGLKISSELLAVALRVELASAEISPPCAFESLNCFQLGAVR
jgi:phosphoribosylcarboxyaminoimidazole (NCAIR) mutase